MKKSIYGGLLLAALSTVGCTKETGILPTDPVENRETVVLSLDAPATRTSLSEDRKITWTSGDAINVNGINYIVEVNEQTGAATVEVIKADAYTAVFPASRFDAATSTLTLPEIRLTITRRISVPTPTPWSRTAPPTLCAFKASAGW